MYVIYTCSYDEFAKGNQGTYFTRHESQDKIGNILSLITRPNDYARVECPGGEIRWYCDGQRIDYDQELKRVNVKDRIRGKIINSIW